jgi:predicted nucleic acid-binding protein
MAGRMRAVVIDANLAVALVVALPYSKRAAALIEEWQRDSVLLYAPLLWEYEVTTAVRKVVAAGGLLEDGATVALERMLKMRVQRVPPDTGLHLDALKWAQQLGQVAAYDAQYLALAARLGAEFWTADKRLAQKSRASGANWVHGLDTET